MATGWLELMSGPFERKKKEFVSVDARDDMKNDSRAYELLSKETSIVVTPLSPVRSPSNAHGRQTPDYFGQTARYHAPTRSYSAPRAPQMSWDPETTYAPPTTRDHKEDGMNPLGMNRI